MSLPTVTRSWQFAVNQSFATASLANNRALMRAIKNQLIGAGGLTWTDGAGLTTTPVGGWTVIGSSDSSTAGLDAVDRWAADANLVWANAGSAHSWIVLQQTGISATFQMLLALDQTSATGVVLTIVVSHNAFTGGSTTANPTATNSSSPMVLGAWGANSAAVNPIRLHVMRSADGAATRVIMHANGFVVGTWQIEKMGNVTSGVGQPYIAFAQGQNTNPPAANVPSSAEYSTTANSKFFGVSLASAFVTCEGWGAGPAYSQVGGASNFTSASPMLPCQLWSTTASNRGRIGTIVDGWFGLTGNANGSAYPDTGTTRQFVQHGVFITPWNRTTPAIS